MSTFLNTASFWDNGQEYNFRQWKNYLSSLLTSAGFVKTSDTGQLATNVQTPLGYVLCNNTSLTLTSWYNIFDQSTATTWGSGINAVAGVLPNTIFIVWDCGSLTSPTAATYKIYMQGTNGDPSGWTLQGSNDNSTWTTLDTQSGISVTAGYQTYTIASPASYRYYRLAITNVRNAGSIALTFTDWQLMTSAPANIISYTPAYTTGINTAIGYEIWRFADTLQSTASFFFKIEYGLGSSTSIPSLWLTFGSGSDGFGNITGLNITTRTQIVISSAATLINTFAPTFKTVGSYATNGSRICIGFGTNTSAVMVLVLERIKTSTGTEAGTGIVCVVGVGSATAYVIVCPNSGPALPVETAMSCLAPTTSTGVTGTTTALYEVVPFMGPRQPMMMGCLGYFAANLTQDTPITVPVYGSNHTYYPIGNSYSVSMKSSSSMSLALLYE